MTDHIAAARARVDAHGRSTSELRELGAVLDALDLALNRAANHQVASEQYLSDCQTYRRQIAERDATVAALHADLALLKRPRRAVPVVGTINDGVVTTKPPAEDT